jgi:ribosomal protein S27AE
VFIKYRAHGLSGDRSTLAYRRNYWRNHSKQKQQYTASWRKRNPLKKRAHTLVRKAVARGVLRRPSHCEECGAKKFVYAHHDDYFRPLEVRWMCPECHRQHHKNEGTSTLKQTEDPWPVDLIAFKWANTLSPSEQDALLADSVKRLQDAISAALQPKAETELEKREQ